MADKEAKEDKEDKEKRAPLSDRYDPGDVEGRIYSWWEESGYFQAEDVSTKPPFSILFPLPM